MEGFSKDGNPCMIYYQTWDGGETSLKLEVIAAK
jgi:hypothetical protein